MNTLYIYNSNYKSIISLLGLYCVILFYFGCLVVYDNLEYYKSFLNRAETKNAVWTKTVNLMNFEFRFEIRHPLYYLFTIEFFLLIFQSNGSHVVLVIS